MPDPRLPLSAESLCDIEACGDCRSWVTPLVAQARAAIELAAEVARLRKVVDAASAECEESRKAGLVVAEAFLSMVEVRIAHDGARRDAGLGGGTNG